jgi:hypothetical protein
MPRRPREMEAPSEELMQRVLGQMREATTHFLRLEALARSFLGWVQEFQEELSRLTGPTGGPLSDSFVRTMFLEARRKGACAKTLANERDLVYGYSFSRKDMGPVMDRIAASQYSSAIRAAAANETSAREKVYPTMQAMLELAQHPGIDKDLHVQALWFVCCVTGNRPVNLYHAWFEVEEECLVVHFHDRKSGNMGREGLEFPWRWSGKPPPFVVKVLAQVRERYLRHPAQTMKTGWRLHCGEEDFAARSYQVAPRLNRFLQKRGRPWTSTTPRDVQATALRRLVGSDPVLPDHGTLDWLMDHTEATARNHYMKRPGREVDALGRTPARGQAPLV